MKNEQLKEITNTLKANNGKIIANIISKMEQGVDSISTKTLMINGEKINLKMDNFDCTLLFRVTNKTTNEKGWIAHSYDFGDWKYGVDKKEVLETLETDTYSY